MNKIYIVEDDPAIREILEIFLISEDFDVQSFDSVSTFSQRDKNVNPDLFLFDIMLPDGSGIELCNQIKSSAEDSAVPVIMMSAHAQISDFKEKCNPEDFIHKPFDIDNLLFKIRNALNQNK